MKRAKRRKAFTLVEVVLVVAIFALMMILLTPFVKMIKRHANNMACANNLRQISLALHSYAADKDEKFPPGLGALYPDYIKDETVYDCPSSKNRGTPDKPDYDYVTGLVESAPQNEVIVYDMDGNHKNQGKNILRINGSIEWVSKAQGKPR